MIKKIFANLILLCFVITSIFPQASYINEKLDEQDNLLQSLEQEMNNVRLMVDQLKANNEELSAINVDLEKTIESCNVKIDNLLENIESMRKALISNKEDTHNVISVLGDIQQELENYKGELAIMTKKNKNANIFVQIMIPALTLPLIGYGAFDYYVNNNNIGRDMMWVGVVGFVGAEVVWNGGKFFFKLW